MTVEVEKRALRERMLAVRRALPPPAREAAAEAVAVRVGALPGWAAARTVALYPAMGGEVDTTALAAHARSEGKRVAWPRQRDGARALELAACEAGALVPGPLGTRQPPPSAAAIPAAEVDLVVVPGVAFDDRGRRLGRGGGHYDATLAALPRAFAVGLCYEAQLVPEVPSEPHDARVDAVVTEARTLLPPGPARARTLTPGRPHGGNTPP
jgi:5-formyltetrahydrofolate cyclo-ligase